MSAQPVLAGQIGLHRLLICYIGALLVTQAAGSLAGLMPTLVQPFLAISLVRYAVVYAIAASVFESNRGYPWLVAVIAGEFLIGMTTYFASFLQPVFLLIIAMVSSRNSI